MGQAPTPTTQAMTWVCPPFFTLGFIGATRDGKITHKSTQTHP